MYIDPCFGRPDHLVRLRRLQHYQRRVFCMNRPIGVREGAGPWKLSKS